MKFSTGFKRQMSMQADVILNWFENLPTRELVKIVPDEEAARHTYVFSADMIKGFCKKGNLASPRIDALTKPIVELFVRAYESGVTNFVLVQDCHDPHAKEFEAFLAHGIQGTEEAETIPELAELPFADKFVVFLKNTLSSIWAYREKQHKPPEKTHPIYPKGFTPIFREGFDRYLETQDIHTAIVVGNCTDLCVKKLAMYLKMCANEHQKDIRVVIPANCVETFDLPFDVAQKIGAMPHPGDMYNLFALYEMARNKIEIVREIA